MSEHPLDRVFRERLAKQEAGPVDHLWSGIARRRKQHKQRKQLAYLLGLLAALFILTAIFLILRPISSTPATAKSPQAASDQLLQADRLVQPDPGEVRGQGTADSDSPSTDQVAQSSSDDYLAGLPQVGSIPHAGPTHRLSQESRPPSTTPFTTSEAKNPLSVLENLQQAASQLDQWPQSYASHPSPSATSEDASPPSEYNHISELPRADIFTTVSSTTAEPRHRAAVLALTLQPHTEEIVRKRRSTYDLELAAGPAYANQILKATSETQRPLLDAREISEFPGLSYLAELRLRKRYPSGISLRAGLSYSAIRNELEYELASPGRETEFISSTNSLHLLEIPLMVGYELPGRSLNVGLSAGPVVNLTVGARGSYLDPESEMPVSFQEEDVYLRHGGLAWRINLSTSYALGHGGTRLLLEPTFTHYPSSLTSDANPLSERYWVAGLRLGIRKRL